MDASARGAGKSTWMSEAEGMLEKQLPKEGA